MSDASPRLKFAVVGGTAPARTQIPIAPAAQGDLLSDASGAPIWPISGPEDANTLQPTLDLFGGTAVAVVASPSDGERPVQQGLVVGLGETHREARLYGHLTGRDVKVVDHLGEVDVESTDVILVEGTRLSRSLVQALSLASYGDSAPGIIWGRSNDELYGQVLSKSAGAVLNGPLQTQRIDVVDGRALDGGGRDLPLDIQDAVGRGAGILTIIAHSDGIGQRIGGTALCSRASPSGEGDPARGPECVETGFCFRMSRPVEQVLGGGLVIAPEALAARALVDVGCHLAFVGNGAVDSTWSLLPRLVANPRIGVLLANAEISQVIPGVMRQELARVLEAGLAVGRAIVKFEGNPSIREVGYRILLFGDPMTKATPPAGPTLVQEVADDSHDPPDRRAPIKLASPDASSVPEIMKLIARSIRPETRENGQVTARALMEAIQNCEAGQDDEPNRDLKEALRLATLRHLATTKVRLYEAWGGVSRIEQSAVAEQCLRCGWRARPRTITLPSGSKRLFFVCPSCSDVMDVPKDIETIDLDMAPPKVKINGTISSERCSAAVFIVRNSPKDTVMIPWPGDGSGRLAGEVDVSDVRPRSGPGRIYALFIEALEIHSFSIPARFG